MRTTTKLLGLAATATAAVTLAAAPAGAQGGADVASPIDSTERFTLTPNTTETYRMPIAGLGTDQNVLLPCWGYEVKGEGIDLVGAELPTTGLVFAEPVAAHTPNGGIPGAARRADGTLWIDGPKAPSAFVLERGVACASIGWRFYHPDGTPKLDEHGNPRPAVVGARAARKSRAKAKRLRASVKRARAAQSPAVEVLAAELHNDDPLGRRPHILVTVKTGALPAGTTLTTRASVLPQRVDPRHLPAHAGR